MWQIDKTFDFCYSHRVYVQKLNTDLCSVGDTSCACRHIHGHQGKVQVFLEGDHLDDRSMVLDFKETGFIKDFINNYLDHKFIIDRNDPMFEYLVTDLFKKTTGLSCLNTLPVTIAERCIGQTIHLDHVPPGSPEYEILEGYFIVDFVPTSENLSKWLHTIAQHRLKEFNIKVQRVEFWETPKSRSSYIG